MNKKQMLTGISVVALSLATAGCAPTPENSDSFGTYSQSDESVKPDTKNENVAEKKPAESCKNMELVQGEAYSGDEKEVWYCNDEGSSNHGSFFMPFVAGYFTSNLLNSKHGINVSDYKPGSSKKIVSSDQYNKSIKTTPKKTNTVTPKKSNSDVKTKTETETKTDTNTTKYESKPKSSTSKSKSSSFRSSTRSSGFGSSGFSSGG
ncbi:DUF1190 domain-containing protein [Rossellomorea marisflavi]|uniref:DUF1190 domain-containing protein n=1 Tax=Rossellomorea marisflavi TaxID=189381 RepID=UPI003F9FAB53